MHFSIFFLFKSVCLYFLQWVVMCWRNWRIVKFFGDWQWENHFDFSLFLENNYILQACLVVIPLNILGNLKQHCSQNQGSLGVFLANHSFKKKKIWNQPRSLWCGRSHYESNQTSQEKQTTICSILTFL